MKTFKYLFITCIVASSCKHVVQKADEATSTASKEIGRQVGEKSSELVNGVKEAVDRMYDCKLDLSPTLTRDGLSVGKFVVNHDSTGRVANTLSVYLIAEKDINKQISAKVTDAVGHEYGRVATKVQLKAGEAHFVDFIFDKRTDIESRSKIELY